VIPLIFSDGKHSLQMWTPDQQRITPKRGALRRIRGTHHAGSDEFKFVVPGCALAQARNPYSLWQRSALNIDTGVMDSGLALRAPRNDEL
jgi:hypothetical protein